eukprot:1902303-Rhodomonas_salina.1
MRRALHALPQRAASGNSVDKLVGKARGGGGLETRRLARRSSLLEADDHHDGKEAKRSLGPQTTRQRIANLA